MSRVKKCPLSFIIANQEKIFIDTTGDTTEHESIMSVKGFSILSEEDNVIKIAKAFEQGKESVEVSGYLIFIIQD